MTFEEAKKILEKEGFKLGGPGKSGVVSEAFAEYEAPEICEAMQIVCSAGFQLAMLAGVFDERKERLKKEYEENTKAPGSPLSAVEGIKLKWKDNQNTSENPALEESASQFNDALLDEQAKKIAELTKDKELMKKATLLRLDDFIEIYNLLTKESQKTKRLGKEIAKLNGIIHDKNAVLADVAEELRLSKIREKNLTGVSQKYMKENEELKEKLANKVVDKIDAQALKSSESALAWKEKVIAEKDMALAYNEKEIADLKEKLKSIYKNRHIERVYKKKLVEKDEVIDNLHKELKAQKGLVNHISKKYDGAKINLNLRMKECEKLKEALDEANKHQQQAYRSCTDKNNEIRALKLQISALEKRGNGIDWKRNADAIKLYVNRASHEHLWNPISQDICNEKELSFIINHGGKRVKYALHFDGTDIVYECSDPDKKNNDLMVGVDIAEEGAYLSGVIVLCGKNLIDAIKKNEVRYASK